MQRLPVALFLCLVAPLAMGAQLKGAVYSPKPGIVCDTKAQFCAGAQVLSLAFTKEYLGDKAEQTVMNRFKEAGGPANDDLTWFGFSNGVDCKTKEKVCHVSKHSDIVDAAAFRALSLSWSSQDAWKGSDLPREASGQAMTATSQETTRPLIRRVADQGGLHVVHVAMGRGRSDVWLR